MSHNLTSTVNSLQFCPYEDVLGVGHGNGFTSLLIPGNPFNHFPASHDVCCLHLFLGSLYGKQYGPRSDCSREQSDQGP